MFIYVIKRRIAKKKAKKIPKNVKMLVVESWHFKQFFPNLAYPRIQEPHKGPSYPKAQLLFNPPLDIIK